MKLIIGAGLTGLIAAHAWPQATVMEAAPGPSESHKALLRFRTDAVSKLTGIEFRRVRVHKGIWDDYQFVAPSIRVANLYASKVLGTEALRGERSIWNIDPVDRYIAPEDFYEQLVDSVRRRIDWGTAITDWSFVEPVVNTAPLPRVLQGLVAQTCEPPDSGCTFQRKPIRVKRWRIPGADLYQTVYFPSHSTPMYRASITKDLLIVELATGPGMGLDFHPDDFQRLQSAFGIGLLYAEPLPDVEQKFGKIDPLPDVDRKRILFWLTQQHNVYSLGRFATWRNVLLDDVVDDIAVIKRLSRSASGYDLRKQT